MKPTYYCPTHSVWEVTLDEDDVTYKAIKVYVISILASEAAILAQKLMDDEWRDNNLEVKVVKWLSVVNVINEDVNET